MEMAFTLPDIIFNLPEDQRAARAITSSDLCSLDNWRYFIRGTVDVPVPELETLYGWGVWAEVSKKVFVRYRKLFDQDGSAEPPAAGILANVLPDYDDIEQPLEIHFGLLKDRPAFIPSPTDSVLYREYVEGMPLHKWHSIIELGKSLSSG